MKLVHKQTDNGTIKEIIQQGNHFFARVTEPSGEVTESQDFNTIERAKESIGIKPTIKENNKLLAEFMGEKLPYLNEEGNFEFIVEGAGKVSSPNEEDLYRFLPYKYNTDWNLLMQVVDKIYEIDLYYDEYIDYNNSMFSSGRIKLSTNIRAVYEDCVEFVKWYGAREK